MAQQLPYEQNAFRAVHADGAHQAPATPWNQLMEQAVHGAVSALDKAATDAVQLEDFSADQQADYHLNLIREQADTALQQRLSLPDGDDESFYEANGVLRKNKVMDFLSFYRKGADRLAGLGVTPQTREQIFWKTQNTLMGVVDNLARRGVEKQKQLAMKSLEDNYNLALSQNRWEDAAQIAEQGAENFLYSKEHGNLLAFNARKTGVRNTIPQLMINSPELVAKMKANGELDEFFSPAEQAQLMKDVLKRRDELNREAANKYTLKDGRFKKNGDPKEQSWFVQANNLLTRSGSFDRDSINFYSDVIQGKNMDENIRHMRQLMIAEAKSFDPNADPLDWEGEFKAKWSSFRIGDKQLFPDAYINEVFRKGREDYDEVMAGGIPYKKMLDNLKDQALLINRNGEAWKNIQERKNNKDEFLPGGQMYETYAESLGLSRSDDEENKVKILRKIAQAEQDARETDILEKFQTWRKTEEGKKANPLEQASKLQQFIKDATGTDLNLKKESEPINNLRQEQEASFGSFRAEHPLFLGFPTADNPIPRQVSTTLAYDAKQTEGLGLTEALLPKSMMKGVKPGKTVVEVEYDNGRVQYFTVKGACEGNSVLLSQERAYQGWDTNEVKTGRIASLTPEQGKSDLERQEEIFGQIASKDIGTAIIYSEARRDRNGNLMVYHLPKWDGGGAYEVGGVNSRYHPKEAAELKYLVEHKHYAQAERRLNEIIMEYTNPAGMLIQSARLSKGVEFIMRDVYFNSGAGGAGRVLRRALGLPGNATREQQLEELKKYRKNPRMLREKLMEARKWLYDSITQARPEKRKAYAGWMNRLSYVEGAAGRMDARV